MRVIVDNRLHGFSGAEDSHCSVRSRHIIPLIRYLVHVLVELLEGGVPPESARLHHWIPHSAQPTDGDVSAQHPLLTCPFPQIHDDLLALDIDEPGCFEHIGDINAAAQEHTPLPEEVVQEQHDRRCFRSAHPFGTGLDQLDVSTGLKDTVHLGDGAEPLIT